jgi:predicted AlkP superfamily pyrophosphatase or phosphodiesterase
MLRRYTGILAFVASACVRTPPPTTSLEHPAAAEPPGPLRHVILVTVDGMVPDAYLRPDAHGLRVPTLRYIVEHGAVSPGARSVFPSVTYPSHTSMATGVNPGRHGIFTNAAFDPLEKNLGGWRWYAEDLKVTPVWELARRAGYRTALISWPATVGANATWLFPEYWRARTDEDTKLLRVLTTPGLLDEVNRGHADLFARLAPAPELNGVSEPEDTAICDIASYVIERDHPHLTMVHLVKVDQAQHAHGLWSPEATYAIENADRQLGRLLQAVYRTGSWGSSAIVVASDHGFAPVTRRVRPGVLLREAGLVRLGEKDQPVDWKAIVLTSSGQAYVYLRSAEDASTAAEVRRIFLDQLGRPDGGIARIYDRDQIRAAGGDASAFLAIEAAESVYFGGGYAGTYDLPALLAATHGYDPERPQMWASLLLMGPGIRKGPLAGARLVDIAPTISAWLGLDMPSVDGRVLLTPGAPSGSQAGR